MVSNKNYLLVYLFNHRSKARNISDERPTRWICKPRVGIQLNAFHGHVQPRLYPVLSYSAQSQLK